MSEKENEITAITKEKTDALKEVYKDANFYCFWSGTMRCLLMEKRESVIHYWLRLSL